MGNIRDIYVEGGKQPQNYETLIPDKIRVLGCMSFPDCSYIETIRISFYFGLENGGIIGSCSKVRKIIELDIEAGYIPTDRVLDELRRLLSGSGYNIFNLDRLIGAFAYRQYYCPY